MGRLFTREALTSVGVMALTSVPATTFFGWLIGFNPMSAAIIQGSVVLGFWAGRFGRE